MSLRTPRDHRHHAVLSPGLSRGSSPGGRRAPVGLLVTGLVLLLAGCDAGGGDEGVPLARAGGHTFNVEEAVSLLRDHPQVPRTEVVVRTLADLWTDYVLLAEAAQDDPGMEGVNLAPLLDPQLEQRMVLAFRDSLIVADTTFTEEELRREFETRSAGVQVRARHILLSFPPDATEAQRDSVEALARELRRRAREGEDFGALARQYSDDQGSASAGGDLGTFGRGEMVPAFEEAAFALDSGEVSDPVETPYGLHVIKLEGRETPSFEENRDRFAEELRNRRRIEAESTFVAELEEPADVRVLDDAYEVVRGLAARPGTELSSRAGRRPLVRYEGGALTARELRTFLQGRTPQQRDQVARATDDQLERILQNLTRRELLLNEARERGFDVSETQRDSLAAVLRSRLQGAVAELGLDSVAVEEGESRDEAVEREVEEVLDRILSGRQRLLPLGNLSFTLREEADAEIYPAAVSMVVRRLQPEPEEDTASEEATGESPEGTPTTAPDTTP